MTRGRNRPGSRRKWGGVSQGIGPTGVGIRAYQILRASIEGWRCGHISPKHRGPHNSFPGSAPPQIYQRKSEIQGRQGLGQSDWSGMGEIRVFTSTTQPPPPNPGRHHLAHHQPPKPNIPQSCRPPNARGNRGLEPGIVEINLSFGGFPLHTPSRKKL